MHNVEIALLPVLFNQETNQCNPYDWNGPSSCLLLLPVHLQNVSQGVLIQTIPFLTPFPSRCFLDVLFMAVEYISLRDKYI